MASSNMRALWEARTDQDLANMSLKPNISANQRKHSNNEPSFEQHRPRLGSSRRTNSHKKKAEKLNGIGRQSTDIEDLDSILLSLQNANVGDEEDDNNNEVSQDVKKTEAPSSQNDTEKGVKGLNRKINITTKQNEIIEVNATDKKDTEKNSPTITVKELVLRQNSNIKESVTANGFTEETTIQSDIKKPTDDVKQNVILKQSKSMETKSTNDMENATNDGNNVLASALKSLRNTNGLARSFDKNEEIKENAQIADNYNDKTNSSMHSPIDPCPNTDVLMRKVDETTTDTVQIKRQSARLSLHNSLEIVPENEPIETKHTKQKENNEKDDFKELIEKLEKCNDLESLKAVCISSFVKLNKRLVEIKATMNEEGDKNAQISIAPPAILAPPPPPPPGPPPPSVAPNKIVITKALKPTMASTATAAVGAVNLMDEIKRKQMIRKQRKSLRSKYETLDNK